VLITALSRVGDLTPLSTAYFTYQFVTKKNGGGERDRTDDLLRARQALSQLSYTPIMFADIVVGLGGLEPPTSRLSGVRSNQLSYRPLFKTALSALCGVATRRVVLSVPMYACAFTPRAPCLKPKSQVLNQKPIFTGFNFVHTTYLKTKKRSFKTE
jgi:hypothetical protein